MIKARFDQSGLIASAFYSKTETHTFHGVSSTPPVPAMSTVSMVSDGKRWWIACVLWTSGPKPATAR